MSMISSACADWHNEILAGKAKELRKAIDNRDWEKVEELQRWLEAKPFSE